MKIRYLLLFLLLVSASTFAQKVYPLVSIRDIQYRPDDSLKAGKQSSPLSIRPDTVRIRAIAMHSTLKNPNDPTSQPLIFPSVTTHFTLFVQDSSKEWGGIMVYQAESNDGTMLNTADSAQYIEFTGYPSEYNTTTEFMLITKPTPVPINTIGQAPKRPAAIDLKISDFQDNGAMNPLAEKYEEMYVQFRNVTVIERNTADGSFKISDEKGNTINMYAQSGYNAIGKYKFSDYSGYVLPQNGAKLDYIRGMISERWSGTLTGYFITPLYPDDIKIASQPPTISTLKRNTDLVSPSQNVDINATIVPQTGGSISEAKVYYRVNGGTYSSVTMSKASDTTVFKGTIPGVAKDSALVDYFVWAKDNVNQTSIFPSDTAKGNYLYMVLNRPLTIKDVQYSPLGGGYGPYSGYKVTLTGIVTADSSDIPGNGGAYLEMSRVFMQDASTPWSGIWVFGPKAYSVKAGDKITVSGTITENYSFTRVDSITTLNVISSNNPIPSAIELSTSDIATKTNGTLDAEKYEGMLIKFKNLTVLKSNADDNTKYNDGEMLVADQSGVGTRVELQDGAGTYHNSWDTLVVKNPGWTKISTGDKFNSITGVLIYSSSNYKLVPRKNSDYVGFKTSVETISGKLPVSYNLLQNYPNPFNPTTTIEYSIPQSGMVSLRIYNLLGQEVAQLVNQFQQSGSYKASFNANSLPSGVYLYKLNSGSYNSVKKMLLLK
ncbi:MAG: T9SS type A sorting domain-containing protein [Bacteroidota bacterium]|nr:T9SS type A sorting domain-containing protein [Bacteroidota bacterium]